MEQEERICYKEVTVRVSAGGGCEAAVTARTRCGWAKCRECGNLLYSRRFPLKMKGVFIGVVYGQQYCMQLKHSA